MIRRPLFVSRGPTARPCLGRVPGRQIPRARCDVRCVTVMPEAEPVDAEGADAGVRARLDGLIDEYRARLHDALDGLTEEEARLLLVPPGRRCAQSREALATLGFGHVVDGRGERRVWALHLQVLRELAHHCGHADILREQILARRAG